MLASLTSDINLEESAGVLRKSKVFAPPIFSFPNMEGKLKGTEVTTGVPRYILVKSVHLKNSKKVENHR